MRALCGILAFVCAFAGLGAAARADAAGTRPRASTSVATQWNNFVLRRVPLPRRHPRLTVTAAAVAAPLRLGVAAYDRVARLAHTLLNPRYQPPALPGPRRLRAVDIGPYAPYFGCYGLRVTFETDALLR